MQPCLALWSALALISSPSMPHRVNCRTSCMRVAMAAALDEPPSYATTASGLKVRDTARGTGTAAALGEVVTIRFSGNLLSRATRRVGVGVPDQPWQVNPRTETFAIGQGKSLMWEEACLGMCAGGRRTVLVPTSARLRPTNSKGRELQVPAGDTVSFTCEMLGVRTGALALGVRSGLLGVGSLAPAIAVITLTNVMCYLYYGWAT